MSVVLTHNVGVSNVYDDVRAYELAFGYRDVPSEVDVLSTWFERHTVGRLERVLELAAGPADHALEFARRGIKATALDLNASMCRYAAERARLQQLPLSVVCADMTDYDLAGSVDLVIVMLDSVVHLLTLDAFTSMLSVTARHTRPGGLLILEMSHPGDFLTSTPRTEVEWESTSGDVSVRVRWGHPSDPFDPITQIQQTHVRIVNRRGGEPTAEVRDDVVQERRWTATEVDAGVRLSGKWQSVARYGALAADQEFDNTEQSWRMIQVLHRDDN